MPRVKRGTHRRASRKKTLALASGYFLTKSKLYRAAQRRRRGILPCYNRLVFPAKIQGIIMPKLKTHKGASKRFKKTGTGLVVRNHAFGRHILTSKPHKRKKKLHQSVVADKADQPVLKRMIPY